MTLSVAVIGAGMARLRTMEIIQAVVESADREGAAVVVPERN